MSRPAVSGLASGLGLSAGRAAARPAPVGLSRHEGAGLVLFGLDRRPTEG
jgi:hypothetical protein